ncbi:MAG: DUF1109 domain-containing protein [Telluria sp.]
MKTDELVALLAKGAGPVEQDAAARRFIGVLGWGMFGTALAMVLTMRMRSDIAEAMLLPMFWIKLAFPSAVAIATYTVVTRLGRPGKRLGLTPGTTLVALLMAVWMLAIATLFNAAPAERSHLVLGDTWLFCLVSIPLLSIPVFVAAMRAMKELAPTRLSLAGGAAGLFAGAASAAVYSLHCTEMEAPFLAIWYVLGMSIPAIAGAAIGPRLLRW